MLSLRVTAALIGQHVRGSSVSRISFQRPAFAQNLSLTASRRSVSAVTAMATDAKATGTVKWFNSTKGYGFITPDNGSEDLFVHQTSIQSEGFRSLREGEPVEFFVETSDDGRTKATNVTGPGGAPPEGDQGQRGGGGGFGGGGGSYGGGGGSYGGGGGGYGGGGGGGRGRGGPRGGRGGGYDDGGYGGGGGGYGGGGYGGGGGY